jgi:hypothetical protein
MKRFLIFLGVGPIVGFFVMMIVSGAMRSISADAVFGVFLVLPFVFIIGLVPALIAAIVDLVLERGGVMSIKRWVTIGVIGYLATYILVAPRYFEQNNIHSLDYRMGLIGGLAGILCSWLAEQRRDHQQSP